jgi:hypothetical protein
LLRGHAIRTLETGAAMNAVLPRVFAASMFLFALIPCDAEEISIQGGYLDMTGTNGPLVLTGTRGFTFQSRVSAFSGRFEAARCNADPLWCIPGATLNLYAAWSGEDLTGRASLDGVEYPHVNSSRPPYADLRVEFFATLPLPAMTSPHTIVATSFQLFGTFGHPESERLVGEGSLNVYLEADSRFPGSWHLTRVLYEFGSPLPVDWFSHDVGAVDSAGSALFDAGTYFVTGDGRDIWDTQDAFRFAYHRASNAASITARVVAHQGSHRFAKAGVMLRQSLDPGSPHVILDLKPDGDIEFMTRPVPGETIYIAGATAATAQPWLKLVRVGQTVVALQSADGWQWSRIGAVVVPLPVSVLAGLAVTSHTIGVVNAAVFDNVEIVTTPTLTDNLLVAGDFEDYETPALGPPGWVSDDYRQSPAVSDASNPHTGFKHGVCRTRVYLDCGLHQEVVAPNTGVYTLRAYAGANGRGGLVGANVNGMLAASSFVDVGDGTYHPYSMAFSVTEGDRIRVWMYAFAGPGTVVIDDVSLTRSVDAGP